MQKSYPSFQKTTSKSSMLHSTSKYSSMFSVDPKSMVSMEKPLKQEYRTWKERSTDGSGDYCNGNSRFFEGHQLTPKWKQCCNGFLEREELFRQSNKTKSGDGYGPISRNGTLSLHIKAYENSIEATSDAKSLHSQKGNARAQLELPPPPKNPFELPRQQENGNNNQPEIMQFKASQQLLNPNETATSLQQCQQIRSIRKVFPFHYGLTQELDLTLMLYAVNDKIFEFCEKKDRNEAICNSSACRGGGQKRYKFDENGFHDDPSEYHEPECYNPSSFEYIKTEQFTRIFKANFRNKHGNVKGNSSYDAKATYECYRSKFKDEFGVYPTARKDNFIRSLNRLKNKDPLPFAVPDYNDLIYRRLSLQPAQIERTDEETVEEVKGAKVEVEKKEAAKEKVEKEAEKVVKELKRFSLKRVEPSVSQTSSPSPFSSAPTYPDLPALPHSQRLNPQQQQRQRNPRQQAQPLHQPPPKISKPEQQQKQQLQPPPKTVIKANPPAAKSRKIVDDVERKLEKAKCVKSQVFEDGKVFHWAFPSDVSQVGQTCTLNTVKFADLIFRNGINISDSLVLNEGVELPEKIVEVLVNGIATGQRIWENFPQPENEKVKANEGIGDVRKEVVHRLTESAVKTSEVAAKEYLAPKRVSENLHDYVKRAIECDILKCFNQIILFCGIIQKAFLVVFERKSDIILVMDGHPHDQWKYGAFVTAGKKENLKEICEFVTQKYFRRLHLPETKETHFHISMLFLDPEKAPAMPEITEEMLENLKRIDALDKLDLLMKILKKKN